MEKLKIRKGEPYLEVITGPMFSGKSQEVNRRLTNIDYYNKHRISNFNDKNIVTYIVLRPEVDTRSDNVRSVPYSSKNWKFVPNNNILEAEIENYDYIILDEAQFFSSEIINQVDKLLHMGKYIIICGLDKDYKNEPFSEFMKWALAVSDEVTKLTAICAKCGAPSTMAKLLMSDSTDLPANNIIIEDENHRYIPVCRKCMYNLIKR